MELQLLSSYNIDKYKWDECLYSSTAPFIYASSAYLDKMADNWDGIIAGNYEYVMPIPWRKKFGIKYCYAAPFIQQLGVFGKNFQQQTVNGFNKFLHENFKYGDYAFNYLNEVEHAQNRNNYTLSLASRYSATSFFYSDKLKADLSKAGKNALEYTHATAAEAIDMFSELYSERVANISQKDYSNLYALCLLKEKENDLIVRKVCAGKETMAINLLMKDKFRMYNLISCTTPEGRHVFAGHFIYDNLIKEFSQSGLVFDFEGSDIPGIAHFYKSFGAINQPYPNIHFNKLPYILQLFKR
jgi:hypothetical protein